jgi:uncharacterized membrane protein
MAPENHVQQERWVLIAYILILMSLFLGVTWIIALWVNHSMLEQPHEVWIRSHQLWIVRTCFIFLLFIIAIGLFSLPLVWLPLSNIYALVSACIAGGFFVIAWLLMLYRGCRGISRYMQGKAVY